MDNLADLSIQSLTNTVNAKAFINCVPCNENGEEIELEDDEWPDKPEDMRNSS
jgi:hypothetical protein